MVLIDVDAAKHAISVGVLKRIQKMLGKFRMPCVSCSYVACKY